MLKPLLTSLLILFAVIPGFSRDKEPQYVRIHPYKVMIDDSLCYQVRVGDNRPIVWEPFCGEFRNLVYREGYEYTALVGKYDPNADSMHVEKVLASSDTRMDIFHVEVLKRLMRQDFKAGKPIDLRSIDEQNQFMRVYPYKVKVNDSLCYEVEQVYGGDGKGIVRKEPFCGAFKNLEFEEGKEYSLAVEKYDPQADTIFVRRSISFPWVSKEALEEKAKQLRRKKEYSQGVFMRVHKERITVNDSLCYQIRKRWGGRDTTAWEPFCGKFSNFLYEEGEEYALLVKEYNPHADTIFVIKKITRFSYNEMDKLKELREKRMRLKEKERNDTIRAIPVKRGKER